MVMIIFYVFWGEESDNGICFHPSRLDFAVLEVAIFQHIEKWSLPIQQNLAEYRCDGWKQMPLSSFQKT